MGTFLAWYIIMLVCGALIGLIPFGLGKYLYKPHMGQLGLILCAVSALLHPALPLAVATGCMIALVIVKNDIRHSRSDMYFANTWGHPKSAGAGIHLCCMAGPLKGRVYTIGAAGLTIGRDNSCTVRLPDGTAGISRHHCSIRLHRGALVLVDMHSAYGTFLGDGTRLSPDAPMRLGAGSRFYLGSPNVLFEIRCY